MSQIKLTADSGGGTTSLKAPSSTTSNADVVLKLPVADGSANQVLKTDGSGQLSFTSNAGTTINNNADNRIITGSGTANTLEGEDKFTWNGNNLHVERTVTAYEQPLVNIYNSGAYGWGGAIRFSANWANTEEHQATIKTYGGSSATGASLAFNVGAANSEKLRIQNGGGISFNGDTAAANALDDYEEGTWTPTVTYSSSGSASLSEALGHYTKIGRLVHVQYAISLSAQNSGSGNVNVNGLPFQSGSTNGFRVNGHFTYQTAFSNIIGQITVYKAGAATSFELFMMNSTNATDGIQNVTRTNLTNSTTVRGIASYYVD